MNKDAKETKENYELTCKTIISCKRNDFLRHPAFLTNNILVICKNIQNNFNYALSAQTNTKKNIFINYTRQQVLPYYFEERKK